MALSSSSMSFLLVSVFSMVQDMEIMSTCLSTAARTAYTCMVTYNFEFIVLGWGENGEEHGWRSMIKKTYEALTFAALLAVICLRPGSMKYSSSFRMYSLTLGQILPMSPAIAVSWPPPET